MVDVEETKRSKAKQLRYKKPIVRNLNLETITQDLWDIQEECENVRRYTDSEDGEDSLINALDGDEDRRLKSCMKKPVMSGTGTATGEKGQENGRGTQIHFHRRHGLPELV